MTLDEQILACGKDNGYTNKNYGDIDLQLSNDEIEIVRPKYSFENGAVYFKDPGHWEIYNHVRHYIFSVTDDMFKQWQRDYKIKELCKEIPHKVTYEVYGNEIELSDVNIETKRYTSKGYFSLNSNN